MMMVKIVLCVVDVFIPTLRGRGEGRGPGRLTTNYGNNQVDNLGIDKSASEKHNGTRTSVGGTG